jgi:hypothetical protein
LIATTVFSSDFTKPFKKLKVGIMWFFKPLTKSKGCFAISEQESPMELKKSNLGKRASSGLQIRSLACDLTIFKIWVCEKP